jgi:predicted alpha/beta superfamily hydrolase
MRLPLLLFTLSSLAGSADFSGRWAGELQLRPANGTAVRQTAHLVLRQFGAEVEGGFGYNADILTRIRSARADGEVLTLAVGGITMTLRLRGDVLEGDVQFPGAGAPVTSASFRRTARGNGGASGPERPSAVGDIRRLEAFRIPQLDRARRVLVYLPPGYERSAARYPVIYMSDGQNLFDVTTSDRGEWQVDETLERLHRSGQTHGIIVVGVEHGGPLRAQEYMPAALGVIPGAEGERYAEFVAKTLKPYIDSHYRTLSDRDHTAVVGASAGAQIAFHIGTEYPESFSRIGALGFVMGRGARENIAAWPRAHQRRAPLRVYLHVGTEENVGTPADNQLFVEHLKVQNDALREAGYLDSEVKLDIEEGAHHTEAFWARRFERVVEWLFAGMAAE